MEELQARLDEKDVFISIASHYLQHPLVAITMLSNIIAKQEEKNLSAKGIEFFRLLIDAADEMK